ncbi:MAG TPA: hypothetical protein VMS56_01340 [Thermoanaerobaculia bacterium]|nr:hypothetical protein [Thermoanaerobaculia bacterium]
MPRLFVLVLLLAATSPEPLQAVPILTPVGPDRPLSISPPAPHGRSPNLASSGEVVLAVWVDPRSRVRLPNSFEVLDRVRAARFTSRGERLDAIPIELGETFRGPAQALWTGRSFLVIWPTGAQTSWAELDEAGRIMRRGALPTGGNVELTAASDGTGSLVASVRAVRGGQAENFTLLDLWEIPFAGAPRRTAEAGFPSFLASRAVLRARGEEYVLFLSGTSSTPETHALTISAEGEVVSRHVEAEGRPFGESSFDLVSIAEGFLVASEGLELRKVDAEGRAIGEAWTIPAADGSGEPEPGSEPRIVAAGGGFVLAYQVVTELILCGIVCERRYDVRRVELDGEGQPLDLPRPIAEGPGSQRLADLVGLHDRVAAAWSDGLDDTVRAALVRGEDVQPVEFAPGAVDQGAVAFETSGTLSLAAWAERRDGTEIRATRVGPTGVPLDLEGILIGSTTFPRFEEARAPRIAPLPDGFLVAWIDSDYSGRDLVSRTVGLDGTVGPERRIIERPSGNAFDVVGRGDRTLVFHARLGEGILARDVSSTAIGTDELVVPLAGAVEEIEASRQGDRILLVWIEDNEIGGRLLDLDGRPLSAPFAIATGPGERHSLSVVTDGRQWFVLWRDRDEIRAAPLSLSGALLDVTPSVGGISLGRSIGPAALLWDGRHLLVLNDNASPTDLRLTVRKFDPSTSLATQNPATLVVPTDGANVLGAAGRVDGDRWILVERRAPGEASFDGALRLFLRPVGQSLRSRPARR